MPDAIEPQLDELRRRARRRLVGAVVLALAAAVLVPMLLESDPKPLGEDVSVKIPPVDDGKFVSKLGEKGRASDSAAPAAAKPAPASSPIPSDAATVASAKDATPTKRSSSDPAPAQVPAAKPPLKEAAAPPPNDSSSSPAPNVSQAATAPPPKPVADALAAPSADAAKGAKPSAGTFSVQLAAFSDDKGANALANRLKQSGHPAYTEPYTTARGTLWRVRVGPYGTREAAETARTKLKSDGQNGIIATAN